MATQAIPPPPKKKQEDLVKTAISHMTVEEGAGHMTSVDSGAKTPCIRKFLNGQFQQETFLAKQKQGIFIYLTAVSKSACLFPVSCEHGYSAYIVNLSLQQMWRGGNTLFITLTAMYCTVGASIMTHFADTVQYIRNLSGNRGHRKPPLLYLSRICICQTKVFESNVHDMYIHFKICFLIGEMAINRQRCQVKGCYMENKLALTIDQSLEWSKSKLNLICSFKNFKILINKSTCFFEICIFSTWYLFCSNFFPQMLPSKVLGMSTMYMPFRKKQFQM